LTSKDEPRRIQNTKFSRALYFWRTILSRRLRGIDVCRHPTVSSQDHRRSSQHHGGHETEVMSFFAFRFLKCFCLSSENRASMSRDGHALLTLTRLPVLWRCHRQKVTFSIVSFAIYPQHIQHFNDRENTKSTNIT
jgi:hypothetical protein